MCSLRNSLAVAWLLLSCLCAQAHRQEIAQLPDTVANFQLDKSVITEEQKNEISHRGKALRAMAAFLLSCHSERSEESDI